MSTATTEPKPTPSRVRKSKSKTAIEAAKRRSYVLGLVEEVMRAFLAVDVSPGVAAIQAALPDVGWNAIKRARSRLVSTGVVELRRGLVVGNCLQTRAIIRDRAAVVRDALGRTPTAASQAVVPTPEAVSAIRRAALGMPADEPARRKRVHPSADEVRAALRRERLFHEWTRAKREGADHAAP